MRNFYQSPVMRQAFTLVELSVVLVITGLIAGGVLAGRELMHQAQLRKQMNQFQSYEVAYMAFRTKYSCTPGDCTSAAQFFPGVANGNGNGSLDNDLNDNYDIGASWPASSEYQSFFVTLAQAGMVAGSYASTAGAPVIGKNIPALTVAPGASFLVGGAINFEVPGRVPVMSAYRHGTNWLWAVICNPSGTNMQNYDDDCAIFAAEDARHIDDKLDDGNPVSGKFIGFGGYNTNNNCLTAVTPPLYNLTVRSAQCQAAYQIE